MNKFRLLAISCLLLPSLISAQQSPQSDSKEQSETIPSLNYDVEVDLVQVPVRITDKDGKWIAGVKKSDLILEEDGKVQEILYVDEISLEKTTVEPSPKVEENSPVVEADLTQLLKRIQNSVIILVDGCNSGKIGVAKQKKYLQDFLKQSDLPNTVYGIIVLNPVGGYKVLQNFTSDKTLVEKVLQNIEGSIAGIEDRTFKASRLANNSRIEECARLRSVSVSGAFVCIETVLRSIISTASIFAHEEEARASHSLHSLDELFQKVGHIPGQKNVIFLSEGIDPGGTFYMNYAANVIEYVIDRYQFPEDMRRRLNREIRVDSNRGGAQIQKIRELVKRANASGLTVNWVNPEYGKSIGNISAETSALGNFTAKFVNAPDISMTMSGLAEDTGGTTMTSSDTRKFYERLLDNLPRYYVISYRPKRPASDNKFHRISLKGKQENYRIAYKKDFKDVDAQTKINDALASAQDFPEYENSLDFKSELKYFMNKANEYLVMARLGVRYSEILPKISGANVSDELHFSIVVKDKKGSVLVNKHPIVKVKSSYAEFEMLQRSDAVMEYVQTFNLKPGSYNVSVVLLDSVQSRKSTSAMDIQLPHSGENCPVVSPVMLASHSSITKSKSPMPTTTEKGEIVYGDQAYRFDTSRVFSSSGVLKGFYQIYNSNLPSVFVSFKLHRDKEFVNETEPTEINAYTNPDQKLISNFFSVPYNNLPPGKYEFEVAVRHSGKSCTASSRVPFEVKEKVQQAAVPASAIVTR